MGLVAYMLGTYVEVNTIHVSESFRSPMPLSDLLNPEGSPILKSRRTSDPRFSVVTRSLFLQVPCSPLNGL